MSGSTTKLLVVAVVLVVLVLIFANPFEDSIRKDNPEPALLFTADGLEQADRIEINTTGQSPAVLSLVSGEWVVTSQSGLPADTVAVGAMLRAVRKAKQMGIASKNPENRTKFQVGDGGVDVAIFSGDTRLAHFVVGRIGQDFTTSYVRLGDSDEVIVAKGLNRNVFARTQGYRDRSLFQFEPDLVAAVRMVTPEGGWELTRQDTAWVVVADGNEVGVAAEQPVVEQMLRSMATLAADGFYDTPSDTVDTGLDSPEYDVTVRFMNGSEAKLQVGLTNDQNQRFVFRPDRGSIYLMGDWRINNVAKTYTDLTTSS